MRISVTHRLAVLTCWPLLILLTLLAPNARCQEQTVCLQCHGAQTGKGGLPVKAWQGSVHAANGISCNDCHGGDPKDAANAMSPARGFLGVPVETGIPAFCGRCHVGIMEEYGKSAHGRALGKGGPTCVTCHGSHTIMKATLDLINEKNCSRCHPYNQAAVIKEAMRQTDALISDSERKLERFKGEGINTEAREKHLFDLRNRYHRLFHVVDVGRVKRESGLIRQELGTIEQALMKLDEQNRRRKSAGMVVVGGLLMAAILTYLLKKTFDN
ncbi:cytochrome c3 family protein [Geobacter hydrogenophilus]|uniref:Cytochrome c n=1 Tax=Geobacter hydrogenophilus TaxID=40983 RepID=A0A9W6FX82_9BACT|nr:cytochrome c3 family protein [Geobacter hydrogenophilus]MBT0895368.1 cytochrome c3 family protein [Geobacter hydrogenophilus]GLI36551.1 cytochrome c [Geobacter hydrogenophilus]